MLSSFSAFFWGGGGGGEVHGVNCDGERRVHGRECMKPGKKGAVWWSVYGKGGGVRACVGRVGDRRREVVSSEEGRCGGWKNSHTERGGAPMFDEIDLIAEFRSRSCVGAGGNGAGTRGEGENVQAPREGGGRRGFVWVTWCGHEKVGVGGAGWVCNRSKVSSAISTWVAVPSEKENHEGRGGGSPPPTLGQGAVGERGGCLLAFGVPKMPLVSWFGVVLTHRALLLRLTRSLYLPPDTPTGHRKKNAEKVR